MRIIILLFAAVLATACAGVDVPGTYEAVSKAPVREDGDRFVRIMLRPDGRASLTSGLSARPSRFLAEGTWQREGRRITVQLGERQALEFQRAGDQLITRHWDRALGEPAPEFLVRLR